jgi:hypothetical protein
VIYLEFQKVLALGSIHLNGSFAVSVHKGTVLWRTRGGVKMCHGWPYLPSEKETVTVFL